MIRDFITAGLIQDGCGRALGAETTLVPHDNEVVVFGDLFMAGLRFPLDQVIINILLKCGMFLHHLTPNGILHLSIYMWVCKSIGVVPNVKNFLQAHAIHHQPKYVERIGENGVPIKEEAQYGCPYFQYKTEGSTPVTSYKNRWEDYWNCFWFYHTIKVDSASSTHPLSPFHGCLRELVKSYGTRDLVEEYCAVKVFPVKARWSIVAWKDFSNIEVREVEERANIILGPESAKDFCPPIARRKRHSKHQTSLTPRAQKHPRVEPRPSEEVVESSPEESEDEGTGSGSGDGQRNFLDDTLNASHSRQEDIDITSSPTLQYPADRVPLNPAIPQASTAPQATGTADKPFEIQYSDDEPDRDDELLVRCPRSRDPLPTSNVVAPEVPTSHMLTVTHEAEVIEDEAAAAGIMTLAQQAAQNTSGLGA
uniref:Transposase (putative) gypsy type domain-containing protein n=1 Tax=Setaria italica TaxID=4555 RepID=K3ZC03_SETIT